jgi:hypothetical protein
MSLEQRCFSSPMRPTSVSPFPLSLGSHNTPTNYFPNFAAFLPIWSSACTASSVLLSMADYHRPYQGDPLSPPSFSSDPAAHHANGYFSSSTSPHSNAYFSPAAPKIDAFPGTSAGDRRIEIYTTAPSTHLPPPPGHTLALPPPPGWNEGRLGGGEVGGGAGRKGGGGGSSMWCLSDPEIKRRRRVASYKAYSVEGKVKASLRRGLRWFKGKCSDIFHGW